MTCANCGAEILSGVVSFSLLAFFQSRGVKPQARSRAANVRVCEPCVARLRGGSTPARSGMGAGDYINKYWFNKGGAVTGESDCGLTFNQLHRHLEAFAAQSHPRMLAALWDAIAERIRPAPNIKR